METIILIISLVWSVLAIILFFKIWGMTNNVKKISQNLSIKSYDDIVILAMMNKKDDAYNAACESIVRQYVELIKESSVESFLNRQANSILENYQPIFQTIGKEIPDNLKSIKTFRENAKSLLNN